MCGPGVVNVPPPGRNVNSSARPAIPSVRPQNLLPPRVFFVVVARIFFSEFIVEFHATIYCCFMEFHARRGKDASDSFSDYFFLKNIYVLSNLKCLSCLIY
jgi:hypothetical protein